MSRTYKAKDSGKKKNKKMPTAYGDRSEFYVLNFATTGSTTDGKTGTRDDRRQPDGELTPLCINRGRC